MSPDSFLCNFFSLPGCQRAKISQKDRRVKRLTDIIKANRRERIDSFERWPFGASTLWHSTRKHRARMYLVFDSSTDRICQVSSLSSTGPFVKTASRYSTPNNLMTIRMTPLMTTFESRQLNYTKLLPFSLKALLKRNGLKQIIHCWRPEGDISKCRPSFLHQTLQPSLRRT
jgi:hypothetical protein